VVTRPAPNLALPSLELVVVGLLARLLPPGFRDRQRAEWTGDLLAMEKAGAGARWRYLVGAMFSLPALRSVVRRGDLGGPAGGVVVSPGRTLVARVLVVGLGWPVVSWLIAVPLRYVAYDIPGRRAAGVDTDPQDLWPVPAPFWALLHAGAWFVTIGGAWLVVSLGIALAVLGPAQGGRSWARRVGLAAIGVTGAVVAGAVGWMLPLVTLDHRWLGIVERSVVRDGVSIALAGLAVLLGALSPNLARRTRVALVVVGVAAVAVTVARYLPVTRDMVGWFED
jgi:hypothetical protein